MVRSKFIVSMLGQLWLGQVRSELINAPAQHGIINDESVHKDIICLLKIRS